MKDIAVLILTALIICLGAVKLSFPQAREDLRQQTARLAFGSLDYDGALQALGRSFAGGDLAGELLEALGQEGRSLARG